MADDDNDDNGDKVNEELKEELFGESKPVERQWPHVVSLHTVKADPGHDVGLRKEIDIFRRNLPDMIEFYDYESKLCRARFLALVKEGFTEAQALKLCRS